MEENANTNSIKLAEAVGAHFEREHDFRGGKWWIYRHTKKAPTEQ
jgi:RimJ/RimL family protein N-acetyltransferase